VIGAGPTALIYRGPAPPSTAWLWPVAAGLLAAAVAAVVISLALSGAARRREAVRGHERLARDLETAGDYLAARAEYEELARLVPGRGYDSRAMAMARATAVELGVERFGLVLLSRDGAAATAILDTLEWLCPGDGRVAWLRSLVERGGGRLAAAARALVLRGRGEYASAVAVFDSLSRTGLDTLARAEAVRTLVRQGRVMLAAGKHGPARFAFQEASRRDPYSAEAGHGVEATRPAEARDGPPGAGGGPEPR
jgi:tetratricopeptide (TPR) repeat protein